MSYPQHPSGGYPYPNTGYPHSFTTLGDPHQSQQTTPPPNYNPTPPLVYPHPTGYPVRNSAGYPVSSQTENQTTPGGPYSVGGTGPGTVSGYGFVQDPTPHPDQASPQKDRETAKSHDKTNVNAGSKKLKENMKEIVNTDAIKGVVKGAVQRGKRAIIKKLL